MKKIELLAPAGDLEKLKIAIEYGADAVYFGGEVFSLRAGAGGLSVEEIKEALEYVHSRGKKAYITLNIYAHDEDIKPLEDYLKKLKSLPIDAYIVSDPGVAMMIRDIIPLADIHLSTQANTTNYLSAQFWFRQGIKRIILARELSFDEIRKMRAQIPAGMDLEAFVHGAMCISYSGRCLLSNYMTHRDANRGLCAHPCRYKYRLEEEKRPGEYYPIEEDDRGTYIFNSSDLCMLQHMPDIIEAGISSAKIEGRMKSIFYIACVVNAYRQAIDAYYSDKENYQFDPQWQVSMERASHRNFTTGFYYDMPDDRDQNYDTSSYTRDYSFTGLVLDYDETSGIAVVEQRNKMTVGETITVFGPGDNGFTQTLDYMHDEEDQPIESAPHPQQILRIRMDKPVKANYMICRKDG